MYFLFPELTGLPAVSLPCSRSVAETGKQETWCQGQENYLSNSVWTWITVPRSLVTHSLWISLLNYSMACDPLFPLGVYVLILFLLVMVGLYFIFEWWGAKDNSPVVSYTHGRVYWPTRLSHHFRWDFALGPPSGNVAPVLWRKYLYAFLWYVTCTSVGVSLRGLAGKNNVLTTPSPTDWISTFPLVTHPKFSKILSVVMSVMF